jgi:hypothetical protein
VPAVGERHGQHVGELVGPGIDVAPDREQRRDLGEPLEHLEVPDVAGVQDRVGRERLQLRRARRVRRAVGVRDHREPQGLVGPELDRGGLLDERR